MITALAFCAEPLRQDGGEAIDAMASCRVVPRDQDE